MEHHRLGPLVAGAQEELGFPPAADRLLGRLGVGAAGRLQELVDLRGQKLRLTGSRRPGRRRDERSEERKFTS